MKKLFLGILTLFSCASCNLPPIKVAVKLQEDVYSISTEHEREVGNHKGSFPYFAVICTVRNQTSKRVEFPSVANDGRWITDNQNVAVRLFGIRSVPEIKHISLLPYQSNTRSVPLLIKPGPQIVKFRMGFRAHDIEGVQEQIFWSNELQVRVAE